MVYIYQSRARSLALAEDVLLELIVLDPARVVRVDDLEEGVDELALDADLQLGDQVGHLVDRQVPALVQVEVIKDLLQELRVLASELPHARLNFAEQVGDSLLGDAGVLFLGHLPGGLHHAHEVLVRRRAHRQVRVVVVPLLASDNAVVVPARPVEVIEEVLEDLVARLAPLQELGVHRHVVNAGDVADGQLARAITIHHLEGLVHHGHAARRQLVPI